ncbi:MAG TPA: ISNCY family transposase [Thermoplasmatales archaeon]|nr:ISNCY family transposase [Thermoplasmatales archaeon]
MRKVIDMQMSFGEVDIATINFDPRSRDEIPKLLRGLQEIYCNRKVRNAVFTALRDMIPEGVDANNGRRGMDLWKILVLGTLRLSCNWDYDRLMDIANNHKTLRLMLGHSSVLDDYHYPLQTLRDNLSLFTPEVLDRINRLVLQHGYQIVGKKKDEGLRASCDSFVVETDVHYPTDINLLFDAMRKVVVLIMALCDNLGVSGWRKGLYNLKKVKRYFRKAQQLKRSTSKDKTKQAEREQLIIDAHMAYVELAASIIERAEETISSIRSTDFMAYLRIAEVQKYIAHAERQIDQIRRRVAEGETIPHHEKVFSLFEEHTEWINKGKAGISQELGLKVCVVKDQFGFILHHRVMQKETDDQIAVPIIKETKERFPQLTSCSFDKGFHSPENQDQLRNILDQVILPRKGKLSAINKEIENSKAFREARQKHSAVESSINALENHGLDRCLDHGIEGFKRYVALAIVARNIQIMGHILQQKELKRLQQLERRQRQRLVA